SNNAGLHRFVQFDFFLRQMVQHRADRADNTVSEKNPHKGPHQSRGDVGTNGRNFAINGAHGNHNPQYGSNNTKARQGIRDPAHRIGRRFQFVHTGFNFLVHQRFQLERRQVAGGNNTEIIGDKMGQFFIGLNGRITGKQRTGGRAFDIRLNGHNTFTAGFVENVIQQPENIHVQGFVYLAAHDDLRGHSETMFHHMPGIGNQEGTEGGTDDNQNFKGLP